MKTRFSIAAPQTAMSQVVGVEEALDVHSLDSEYRGWNFWERSDETQIEGRGRTFEVLMVQRKDVIKQLSGDVLMAADIAAFFAELGYAGHVGAYLEWRRISGFHGYSVTIPSEAECLKYRDGSLWVPGSHVDRGVRTLNMYWHGLQWQDYWNFVGFRMVD